MRLFHFSTFLLVVAASCGAQGPPPGVYRQVTFSDPSYPMRSIDLRANSTYELTTSSARMWSAYRIVGDSIFLDERVGGATQVALAGVFRADTLTLRVVGMEAFAQDSADLAPVRFVRQPRRP